MQHSTPRKKSKKEIHDFSLSKPNQRKTPLYSPKRRKNNTRERNCCSLTPVQNPQGNVFLSASSEWVSADKRSLAAPDEGNI
jgi:hypothetical protein